MRADAPGTITAHDVRRQNLHFLEGHILERRHQEVPIEPVVHVGVRIVVPRPGLLVEFVAHSLSLRGREDSFSEPPSRWAASLERATGGRVHVQSPHPMFAAFPVSEEIRP